MLLEVSVDNIDDIKDSLDYDIIRPTLYTDLITPELVKIYFAHKLFRHTSTKNYFESINDYIFVEAQSEEKTIDTVYENYTISRNIKNTSNASNWRCISLVFNTLLFLTTEDIGHTDFKEFLSNVNRNFPNIKPLDILYIYMTNIDIGINSMEDSSEIFNKLNNDISEIVEIIYNMKQIKPNERRSKILDLSDEIVKLYKVNERKLNVEKNFLIKYENVVKILEDVDKKCSIKSDKVDTHLDININIISNYDIFEVFNKFLPSNVVPFMHISDFNKIKTEYKVPEDWLEEITTIEPTNGTNGTNGNNGSNGNNLVFYILNEDEEPEANKIKPMSKYYSKCIIKELRQIEGKFELQVTIEIERTKIRDANDRNKIIVKLFKNIDYLSSSKSLTVVEKVAKGYLSYNLFKNLNYIDIPIFRHYFLVDDFITYFLSLEQQYTIERTRGGEAIYFYRNYVTNALIQPVINYDILYKTTDGKINLMYDKVGRDSKTKIKFPPEYVISKDNLPDVLIIKYSKLTLDAETFQRITDRLLCYMNDANNLQEIKSAYENCL